MQMLIGAALALLFIGGLGAAFLFGYRVGKARGNGPMRASGPTKESGGTPKTDKGQKEREEQIRKDFEIISGYNLSKALERKRV